jgi:L-malate glycosyltransferase
MSAAVAPLTIFVPHASDLLTDYLPSGDGLVAYGFIEQLARRGHTVHVVSPRIELKGPVPPGVRFFPLAPRTKIPGIARFDYMLRMRALYNRLARNVRYDVIHQLNPVNTGISLALAGVQPPIVLGNLIPNWSMNEAGKPIPPRRALHPANIVKSTVLELQQRLAAAILLTTPAARERLYQTKAVEHKLFMLPHGVDDAVFATHPVFEDPPAKNVLFFANLLRRKGIFTLLDAFDAVVAAFPDAILTVAGGGDEFAAVQQDVARRPWAANVRLLGNVARGDVAELLSSASVYCLPSYDEPYGMSVLEAMAASRPVVATRGGGLGYLLASDGAVGVPPRDSTALARALIGVLGAAPETRAAMGEANRQAVSSTYAWHSVIPRLEDIYRHVMVGTQAA